MDPARAVLAVAAVLLAAGCSNGSSSSTTVSYGPLS